MKASELKIADIILHLHEYEDNLDENEKTLLEAMKSAAITYVHGYTGLKVEEIDKHEDITIVILSLISDMWDNRSLTVDKANSNKLIDSILSMHSINYLPGGQHG